MSSPLLSQQPHSLCNPVHRVRTRDILASTGAVEFLLIGHTWRNQMLRQWWQQTPVRVWDCITRMSDVTWDWQHLFCYIVKTPLKSWLVIRFLDSTLISHIKMIIVIIPRLMFHLNQVYYLFFLPYHFLSSKLLHNILGKLLSPELGPFHWELCGLLTVLIRAVWMEEKS